MSTILERIISEKEKEVVQLKNRVAVDDSQHSTYSFIKRLEKSKSMSIIAEFKRASPSKGDINPHLKPVEQALAYVNGGADAISVLTDQTFFKGSFTDLKAIRNHVDCPILCKDFIIDTVQIDIAKNYGADVILLIAAALDDERLRELYSYARSKDLEVLMEVHNEGEADRVLRTGNRLIGVNNRDLRTFEVDLGITEKLAPLIKGEGAFLISESGMKTSHDVERVRNAGANGILVGETFMKHPNLEKALKEMKLPLKEVTI